MNAQTKIAAAKPTSITTVDCSALHKALKLLGTVVKRRNTIPVLSNIAIAASSDSMTLRATDLDIELSVDLDCHGAASLKTTVNAVTLAGIVEAAQAEQVSLSIDGDRLLVAAGTSSAAIRTITYDDFPLAKPIEGDFFGLDAARFASDMDFVSPAISREETRYYLNGICIDAVGKRMIATDGHRLNLTAMEDSRWLPAGMPIIPRRTVAVLQAMIDANPDRDTIELAFSTQGNPKMEASIGPWRLKSKLIDGTFPDFSRVLPVDDVLNASFTCEARALLAGLNFCTAICTDRIKAVKITRADGQVRLSTTSPENGEASAIVRGGATSDTFKSALGLNAGYLKAIAKAFGNGTLLCQITDTRLTSNDISIADPTRFTSPESAGRLIVLMPMRV